jgi:hypothetical protein
MASTARTDTPDVVVIEKPCERSGGVSNTDKWIIAAILAVIFIVLVSPLAFGITNWLFRRIGVPTVSKHGRPTLFGIVLHGAIAFVIFRLLMH